MDKLAKKREKEKRTSSLMIELYCRRKHNTKKGALCAECKALEDYVFSRIDHCPHMEEKTFCSACRTHCYRPDMREKIRAVMRFSGPRMLFHHPVMAIHHVAVTISQKRKNRAANR